MLKGLIDLSEVESISEGLQSTTYIQQQQHQQIISTKTLNQLLQTNNNNNNGMNGSHANQEGCTSDARNCFELKTTKRVYYFCAKSQQEATNWIKQLEMCCVDS
jgi:hypothetical protein